MKDSEKLCEILPKDAKISVNVTGTTIQNPAFMDFLIQLQKDEPEFCKRIMIEITEQATLDLRETFISKLASLRNLDYRFAIDDFSMGNTSVKYINTNIFSLIKLDGEICKNIMGNKRSCDIVSSMSDLAGRMNIDMIAEYVETEDQQKLLEKMGCNLYQGYLYSPALPLDSLKEYLDNE